MGWWSDMILRKDHRALHIACRRWDILSNPSCLRCMNGRLPIRRSNDHTDAREELVDRTSVLIRQFCRPQIVHPMTIGLGT